LEVLSSEVLRLFHEQRQRDEEQRLTAQHRQMRPSSGAAAW
jgi:hypothetical protein